MVEEEENWKKFSFFFPISTNASHSCDIKLTQRNNLSTKTKKGKVTTEADIKIQISQNVTEKTN